MIDLDKTKDAVEGEIRYRVSQVKDAYDELESISAKVKMWIKLNKVRLMIDAGCVLVFFLVGLAI
jgi:hypothetical protein